MPWMPSLLRGQRVLAHVDDSGAYVSEGGRVEIRYREGDARAYRAALSNLTKVAGQAALPESACPPGEAAPAKEAPPRRKAGEAGATKSGTEVKAVAADAWIAYTDGACSGNPGPAGSGLIVIEPGKPPIEACVWLGVSTNNVAELTAIEKALELIPKEAPAAVVHTDSQYAIGVLTKGWKPKVNQELITRIKALMVGRTKLSFVYVRGHVGIPLNERADELAREAVSSRRTRGVV